MRCTGDTPGYPLTTFQAQKTLPSFTVCTITIPSFRLNTHAAEPHAGHLPFWQEAEAGELENNYLTTYGSIVRWKGPLGVRESFKKPEHPLLFDYGSDGRIPATRRTVCGSPTLRQYLTSSILSTDGKKPQLAARWGQFCSIEVWCGQKGTFTDGNGKL